MSDETGTPIDDPIDTKTELAKRYQEILNRLNGTVCYFLTMTDIEFIGTIESATPAGFVVSYPARLHAPPLELDDGNKIYLAPLAIYSFSRQMFIDHAKILTYGEAQTSMVEFYTQWRAALIEEERKYHERKLKEMEQQQVEQPQSDFSENVMDDLVKSGKILHFQKTPKTTQ